MPTIIKTAFLLNYSNRASSKSRIYNEKTEEMLYFTFHRNGQVNMWDNDEKKREVGERRKTEMMKVVKHNNYKANLTNC